MWYLPLLTILMAIGLSIPLGWWLWYRLDCSIARNKLERWLCGGENSGYSILGQSWKKYCTSLVLFNIVVFFIGYMILSNQEHLPLNPDAKKKLAPGTVFNTACSFLTNTNLQHYAGEVHLSYFSQIFFVLWKQMISPAIGLAALLAMIRSLRGDSHCGNFYLDIWRTLTEVMIPLSLLVALLLMPQGVPMTLAGALEVTPLAPDKEGDKQIIARGPVAAIVAIKQLGTNGGGFFGTNSSHPFENPTFFTNLIESICIILLPMACVFLFGRMLKETRQARMIFIVKLLFMALLIIWAVITDSQTPNPIFSASKPMADTPESPFIQSLPVENEIGNLEGKELRFGRSAGPTWSALTTCTSNGSVNCMHDSLNPLSGLTPLCGMWLNCIFGGVGVGLINFLIYLLIAVFFAGLMVGRTPEYLGKKLEVREVRLAAIALLVHPFLILLPCALFVTLNWGSESTNNPGAHGFSEILYEFSSASANNGSGFEGLQDTWGFAEESANPSKPAPHSLAWDIATGIVMLLARFIPIIAPIALAAYLAQKKRVPFTSGTLRTDSFTFALLLVGTILLVGALLFLPVAALGPIAEHLGPLPFGS